MNSLGILQEGPQDVHPTSILYVTFYVSLFAFYDSRVPLVDCFSILLQGGFMRIAAVSVRVTRRLLAICAELCTVFPRMGISMFPIHTFHQRP